MALTYDMRNRDFSGKNVIIMGTGGAARTVAYSIMQNYN